MPRSVSAVRTISTVGPPTAVAICALCAAGALQADSKPWQCPSPQRHPDAAPQTEQFEFLLGSFEATVRRWSKSTQAWSEPVTVGLWQGEYILGGRIIADYWYASDPVKHPGTSSGVNNRYYDPETGTWTITWLSAPKNEPFVSRAELRDGRLVMWDVFPQAESGSETISEFEVRDGDHWQRVTYEVRGDRRTPTLLIEARRIGCAPARR